MLLYLYVLFFLSCMQKKKQTENKAQWLEIIIQNKKTTKKPPNN